MKLVLAIVKPFKLTEIVDAMASDTRFPGMTAFQVQGFGRGKTAAQERTRAEGLRDFTEHSAAFQGMKTLCASTAAGSAVRRSCAGRASAGDTSVRSSDFSAA